MTGQYVIDFKK